MKTPRILWHWSLVRHERWDILSRCCMVLRMFFCMMFGCYRVVLLFHAVFWLYCGCDVRNCNGLFKNNWFYWLDSAYLSFDANLWPTDVLANLIRCWSKFAMTLQNCFWWPVFIVGGAWSMYVCFVDFRVLSSFNVVDSEVETSEASSDFPHPWVCCPWCVFGSSSLCIDVLFCVPPSFTSQVMLWQIS